MKNCRGNTFTATEYDPIIYPYKVWIVVSSSTDVLRELFLEEDGSPLERVEDEDSLTAFAKPAMDKGRSSHGVILYFRNRRDMTCGLIAHEASHATKFLFKFICASIEPHEPFEYVLGWIADCCEEVRSKRITKGRILEVKNGS